MGRPLPAAGSYKVYARWTSDTNRASNAAYTITTSTGSQTATVNQQANGSQCEHNGVKHNGIRSLIIASPMLAFAHHGQTLTCRR
jgi:hypothetical protein